MLTAATLAVFVERDFWFYSGWKRKNEIVFLFGLELKSHFL